MLSTFIIKVSYKVFRYCASGPRGLYSRIVNFCRTKAGLASKWGRMSPAVYWWYQNQSSYVEGPHAMSHDVARKLTDYTHTHYHVLRQHSAKICRGAASGNVFGQLCVHMYCTLDCTVLSEIKDDTSFFAWFPSHLKIDHALTTTLIEVLWTFLVKYYLCMLCCAVNVCQKISSMSHVVIRRS